MMRPSVSWKMMPAAISQCSVIATAPYRFGELSIALFVIELGLDPQRDFVAHENLPRDVRKPEVRELDGRRRREADKITLAERIGFPAVERRLQRHGLRHA